VCPLFKEEPGEAKLASSLVACSIQLEYQMTPIPEVGNNLQVFRDM
jgi:hypothetical protein